MTRLLVFVCVAAFAVASWGCIDGPPTSQLDPTEQVDVQPDIGMVAADKVTDAESSVPLVAEPVVTIALTARAVNVLRHDLWRPDDHPDLRCAVLACFYILDERDGEGSGRFAGGDSAGG